MYVPPNTRTARVTGTATRSHFQFRLSTVSSFGSGRGPGDEGDGGGVAQTGAVGSADLDPIAGVVGVERRRQVAVGRDGVGTNRGDHVTGDDSGLAGGTVRLDA